jgi:hypothetical protein
MKNLNFKLLIPIVAAIVIFVALTYGYLTPMLKGKVIVQSDMVSNQGMAKEINDFRDQYHEEPLWTNSMFGGMPAYQISMRYPGTLAPYVRSILTLGLPSSAMLVFNYLLGFYILLLVLRVNPWLSIVGAVAFGFSAYLFIIIDAGHITKAVAIGFMAPVFAGVILVCRKKYLLGAAVTALFMTLELNANHIQITYYLMLFLAVYVGLEFWELIKKKEFTAIGKSLMVFAFAGIIALGCNVSNLLNTVDYVKHTIRGESELTDNAHNKTSGLDRDYVVQWSMGKAETMTLMIPGFKGRSSSIRISENKSALKNVEPEFKESIANVPQYWGEQPFTMSPYSGAAIVFLFVLGLFIVEGKIKWALFISFIISILLSWGKNFMPLTDFFLDYLPGYNKFRAVSMVLMVAEFALPILAILSIDRLLKNPDLFKQKIQLAGVKKEISVQTAFIISFAITGGLSLLYYLMPDLTSFSASGDNAIYDQIAKSNGPEIAQRFIENMEIARKALFKADAMRSFIVITIAAGFIWLFVKSKINNVLLIAGLGIVMLVDLWSIDKGYLNDSSFVSKQEAKIPFPETAADKFILEDKDPNYRVLNIAVNTFNDASTSYRHKSVGGYHAVKLRRYQDLIDRHIQSNIENVMTTLRATPSDSALRATFAQQGVLNMLNTRYIIYNPEAQPLQNRYALGNAWFVKEFKLVKNADEEIKVIGEIDPAITAVIDEKYKSELGSFIAKADNTSSIKLTDYKPNHLKYESTSTSDQLAVFSEIYYNDGWNAYVDGQLKPHFAADYVLRGMVVPAGKHQIEFKFEPQGYYVRDKISLVSSLILFGFVGFSLIVVIKKKKEGE